MLEEEDLPGSYQRFEELRHVWKLWHDFGFQAFLLQGVADQEALYCIFPIEGKLPCGKIYYIITERTTRKWNGIHLQIFSGLQHK